MHRPAGAVLSARGCRAALGVAGVPPARFWRPVHFGLMVGLGGPEGWPSLVKHPYPFPGAAGWPTPGSTHPRTLRHPRRHTHIALFVHFIESAVERMGWTGRRSGVCIGTPDLQPPIPVPWQFPVHPHHPFSERHMILVCSVNRGDWDGVGVGPLFGSSGRCQSRRRRVCMAGERADAPLPPATQVPTPRSPQHKRAGKPARQRGE